VDEQTNQPDDRHSTIVEEVEPEDEPVAGDWIDDDSDED
jgi:hypothetical protein